MRAVSVLVAGVLLASVIPALPATALEVRSPGPERLLGPVTAQDLDIRLSGGAVTRGHVIRFPEDAPEVDLRSHLAQGTVAGLESMSSIARRTREQGGLAGVNGGYFLWNSEQVAGPVGAPNGLSIDQGRLEQGQTITRSGNPTGRASVGWQRSGRLVLDRVRVLHTYERGLVGYEGGEISDLNRQPWRTSQLLLYTDRFGTDVLAPAGALLITLDGLELRSSGASTGRVAALRQVLEATSVRVEPGTHLLLATGDRVAEMGSVVPGETLRVTTELQPEATSAGAWADLYGGVAGGQLLVRDGVPRPSSEWTRFASFDDGHAYRRRARTAIARTSSGEVLLVTVDENAPGSSGWSAGLTVPELAELLLALGARDAVNLDGGGSTTAIVDGRVHNRPSQPSRSVADAIVLHVAPPSPARALTSACSDELVLASVSFLDVAGTTHAEAIGCLASWGITSGVTPTSYVPAGEVTRDQMASFLARWIDDLSSRGSGAALPSDAELGFADVSATSTHAGSIARLAAVGILEGRTATSFRPRDPVTRAQTASLVARALTHITGRSLPSGRDTFLDDNGSVHEANIDRLNELGVIAGVGGFRYQPSDPVTRGAMASLLMRATADLVEDGVATPPGAGSVLVDASDGTEPVSGE